MMRLIDLEEIQRTLSRVSCLTDLLDRRDPAVLKEVKGWLSDLEKVLGYSHLPGAGPIAAIRGMLVSAERGVLPSGIFIHGRPTLRKLREAAAGHGLRLACDLISGAIKADTDRISEAERIGQQIVSLAKGKGIALDLPRAQDRTEALKSIRKRLASDPDISPGIIRLEGLVGFSDSLIVLDRAIV